MITYIPQNQPLTSDIIKGIANGAAWNDDGHGWAIAADTGVMLTGKSMDADEAIEGLVEAREAAGNGHALFHSRWATHGSVSLANAHPFPVGRYGVVAHNGILPSAFHPGPDDDRSDTRILADEWLMEVSRRGTFSRRESQQIAALIGTHNKLVIMSVSPKLRHPIARIVNARQGEHAYGAWFSNADYAAYELPKRHVTVEWASEWDDDWQNWHYNPVTGGYEYRRTSETKVEEKWVDCSLCFAAGTVDYYSNYCQACNSCLDCGERVSSCLCYTGQAGDIFSQRRNDDRPDDGYVFG
jgi:glutamine amidotransferase